MRQKKVRAINLCTATNNGTYFTKLDIFAGPSKMTPYIVFNVTRTKKFNFFVRHRNSIKEKGLSSFSQAFVSRILLQLVKSRKSEGKGPQYLPILTPAHWLLKIKVLRKLKLSNDILTRKWTPEILCIHNWKIIRLGWFLMCLNSLWYRLIIVRLS